MTNANETDIWICQVSQKRETERERGRDRRPETSQQSWHVVWLYMAACWLNQSQSRSWGQTKSLWLSGSVAQWPIHLGGLLLILRWLGVNLLTFAASSSGASDERSQTKQQQQQQQQPISSSVINKQKLNVKGESRQLLVRFMRVQSNRLLSPHLVNILGIMNYDQMFRYSSNRIN